MAPIVVAAGAIVLLFIGFKVLRMVMHGCLKLAILAFLVGAGAAAWYYLRHQLFF